MSLVENKLELIKQFQVDPEKHSNNVMILWDNIGHVITTSFYKKWSKWSSLVSLSWDDARQDLMVGFIESMRTYKFDGKYEVGKWLYIKSICYASTQTTRLLNKKHGVLNGDLNFNENIKLIENIYCQTQSLEEKFSNNVDRNNRIKAVQNYIEWLSRDKNWKRKIKLLQMKTEGKTVQEIAKKFNMSISEVKNQLFIIRKKIKSYLKKNSPDLFE